RARRRDRGGRIELLPAQLSPRLPSLDRQALDIALIHLVEEPGAIADLGLVLGRELPEDQREADDQQEPEPGGRRRPARPVRLAPAGVPSWRFLRRSTLHTLSIPQKNRSRAILRGMGIASRLPPQGYCS